MTSSKVRYHQRCMVLVVMINLFLLFLGLPTPLDLISFRTGMSRLYSCSLPSPVLIVVHSRQGIPVACTLFPFNLLGLTKPSFTRFWASPAVTTSAVCAHQTIITFMQNRKIRSCLPNAFLTSSLMSFPEARVLIIF